MLFGHASPQRVNVALLVFAVFVGAGLPLDGAHAEPDVFAVFTGRIERQIQIDKRAFVTAQLCTQWFYKERSPTPKPPGVGTIALIAPVGDPLDDLSACRNRYPGLDAARQDATRTQSTLSLSLTFYEFALVGDRDDDRRYSIGELRDMMESFGLTFNEVLPATAHLAVLDRQFAWIQERGGLEALMAGMSVLYDRGYRLSSYDRTAIAKISE